MKVNDGEVNVDENPLKWMATSFVAMVAMAIAIVVGLFIFVLALMIIGIFVPIILALDLLLYPFYREHKLIHKDGTKLTIGWQNT